MSRGSWSASGRRPAGRGARPDGSWPAALGRAVDAWEAIGGPARCMSCGAVGILDGGRVRAIHAEHGDGESVAVLSDAAAAAILGAALALWADTAAGLAELD